MGSAWSADTVAVLRCEPPIVGVTISTIVAAPPLGTVPRSQISVPFAWRHDPAVVVALTKVVPSGSVSTSRTFVAGPGPAFDTFIEYEKGAPIETGSAGAVAAIWRLAAEPTAPTVMVTVR